MQTLNSAPYITLTLDDIVRKTNDLPSMPTIALGVIKHTSASDSNAASVAKILSQDQSLVIRILRLVNSPYYAFYREITDITDAVVLLGMRTVRNLALLASTYPWMTKPLPGYEMEARQLWAHSLCVGVGAQVVAERSGVADPESALTAGILHDLGKTALSVWIENKLPAMGKMAQIEETSFDALERRLLGFDHTDVGAHMAKGWNLPRSLIQAIKSHHRPRDCSEYAEIVYCVHVADHLSRVLGIGLGGDSPSYMFDESTLRGLQLSCADLNSVADEMTIRYEEQNKLFEGLAA